MPKIVEEKLERLINECDKHQLRIESAHRKIQHKLPFNVQSYKKLTEDEIEHIDQFLFRFSKLQDAIGQRFFKTILMFFQEEVEGVPFIDILNLLEKLGLINSSQQWQYLREIRNAISHEYDDSPELMVQALNATFEAKVDLLDIYRKLKHAYLQRKNHDNP